MHENIISQPVRIIYELIEQPYKWEQSPFNGEDFVCLLVVNDEEISDETQVLLASTFGENSANNFPELLPI